MLDLVNRDRVGDAGGSRQEAERPAPAASASAPPSLIGGAKCQVVAQRVGEVGCDALRFTLHRQHLEEVEARLSDVLGPTEPTGRFYRYGTGQKFSCGALLLVDPEDAQLHGEHAAVCVELKGSSIARLGQWRTFEIASWMISIGARCTRIDLRSDFRDRPGLVEQVRASCNAGHLRGARLFEPRQPRRSNGELLGNSVTIGRRGKLGSGRFVRVYDKGLETGTEEAGEWERWEVEFGQDAASMVCAEWVEHGRHLLEANGGDATAVLRDLGTWMAERIFGAVDFREGGRLDRTERVSWWAAFLGGLQVVPTVVRRARSSLGGFAKHLRKTVAPSIAAMARATGWTVGQVFEHLIGGEAREASLRRSTVIEFAATVSALGVIERACDVGRWRTWLRDVKQQASLGITDEAELVALL